MARPGSGCRCGCLGFPGYRPGGSPGRLLDRSCSNGSVLDALPANSSPSSGQLLMVLFCYQWNCFKRRRRSGGQKSPSRMTQNTGSSSSTVPRHCCESRLLRESSLPDVRPSTRKALPRMGVSTGHEARFKYECCKCWCPWAQKNVSFFFYFKQLQRRSSEEKDTDWSAGYSRGSQKRGRLQ